MITLLLFLLFDEIDVNFWTATANLSLILRVDLKLCLKIQWYGYVKLLSTDTVIDI